MKNGNTLRILEETYVPCVPSNQKQTYGLYKFLYMKNVLLKVQTTKNVPIYVGAVGAHQEKGRG